MCTSASLGEGICRALGQTGCTGATLQDGICRAAGVGSCGSQTLEEALCKAGGGTNCSGVSFARLLEASIKVCGADILFKVKKAE